MSKIVVGKKFGRTKIRNWFAVAAHLRQAGPMRAATTYNRNRSEDLRQIEEEIDNDNSWDCWD